jgi:predicted RNA-binding protein
MNQETPEYYILIASNLKTRQGTIRAPEFVQELAADGYWLLGERSNFRTKINQGDRALLYAAGGHSLFMGTASITSEPTAMSYRQQEALQPELGFMFATPYRLELADTVLFNAPVSARALIGELSFITNKKRWGGHFQGGAKRIPEEDFNLIVARGLQEKESE